MPWGHRRPPVRQLRRRGGRSSIRIYWEALEGNVSIGLRSATQQVHADYEAFRRGLRQPWSDHLVSSCMPVSGHVNVLAGICLSDSIFNRNLGCDLSLAYFAWMAPSMVLTARSHWCVCTNNSLPSAYVLLLGRPPASPAPRALHVLIKQHRHRVHAYILDDTWMMEVSVHA